LGYDVAKKPALWAVRSTGLILIEAPSSADHGGLRALGKQPLAEEETP
jgi:hypothetical protein